MGSIERRATDDFQQALLCAQYRVPQTGVLRAQSHLLAIAMRYGLIGGAVTCHLMICASGEMEERRVLTLIRDWPQAVENHVRERVRARLPFQVDCTVPETVGLLAFEPMRTVLKMHRSGCSLEQALAVAADQFAFDYRSEIQAGVPLFKRSKNLREFCTIGQKSVAFALNFFDRRQAELEELPEIALIGE